MGLSTKTRLAALLMALALVAVGCGDSSSETADSGGGAGSSGAADCETVVIGDNESATGGAASVGQYYQQGFQLGIDAVNDAGGVEVDGTCYRFEGRIVDNRTDPGQAISNNQKFLADDVKFIFGPPPAAVFVPAFESLQGTDTLVMSVAGVVPDMLGTEEGKYLFDPIVPSGGENGQVAKQIGVVDQEFSPKTAAVLISQDDAGNVIFKAAVDALKRLGIEVVYAKQFSPDTRDFSSFVSAIRQADPDMVFMGYLDQWAKPFFDEAVTAGYTQPVLVGSVGVTADAANTDKLPRYVSAVQTIPLDQTSDPAVQAYRKAYEAKFGKPPSASASISAAFYDPIQMLARAMEIAGSVDDVPAIVDALKTPEATEYDTRLIDLTFSPAGAAEYPLSVAIVRDGKTEYVKSE